MQVAQPRQADDVGNYNRKEAVKPHAGRQGKGFVGQKCHDKHCNGGGNAGSQEHAVPQLAAPVEAGEQIGVQGDDISHRHERGQAGQDFGLYVCTVFLQLKNFLHCFSPSQKFLWNKHPLNHIVLKTDKILYSDFIQTCSLFLHKQTEKAVLSAQF